MKYFKIIITVLFIFLTLTFGIFGKENNLIELKLGHATQTNHPVHIASVKLSEIVNEKSNGQLKIKIYPARVLGDDSELAEQIISGTLEMGVVGGSVFSKYTPLLDTLQLPFLLDSYDKVFEAIKTHEMKEIFLGFEELNLKGLTSYESGIRYVANKIRPINEPDDFKGLKLRVPPSNLLLEILSTLGANPIPMAYGEIYSALQTNVIDGLDANLSTLYAENIYEVLEYVSLIPLFPFPNFCIVNLQVFNNLSPEHQLILEEATYEVLDYLKIELEEMDAIYFQNILDVGLKINKVDNLEPFKEKTKSIVEKYVEMDSRIADFVKMANNID